MKHPAVHAFVTAPAVAAATWHWLLAPHSDDPAPPWRAFALPCGIAAPAVFVWLAFLLWWNRRVRGIFPEDVPRAGRKQHEQRTAMAGLALVPWLAAAAALDGRHVLAAAIAAVAGLGFVDDWRKERGRDLGWRPKAVVLGGAAVAVAVLRFDPMTESASFLLAALVVFVLTNAINFLDNMNGVASAVAAASLLVHSGGEGLFGLCGAVALGFLPWNWPRAHAFLGDSGAYALGLACGAACIDGLPDPRACAPFAVPLFDFAQVVAVRISLRIPPWRGDRRHVSHVFHNAGVPRSLVAPLLAAVAIGVALLLRSD